MNLVRGVVGFLVPMRHAPQAFRPAAVFVDSQEFLPFSERLHITFFA